MTNKGRSKLTNRLFSWAFFWIVFAAVIFLNIISNYVNYRLDMTQDGRYTLSEDTKKFLENPKNLKNRLNVKIYLDGKLPSELRTFRNAIEDKLNEFKSIAGDRIEYEFIDPNVGTEQEQYELKQTLQAGGKGIMKMDLKYEADGDEIKMQVWPGAVLEYGGTTVGHIQFLPGSKLGDAYPINELTSAIENALVNLEYTLLSSINKAVKEKKQRIGFLHGHGELDAYQTFLARANISPYYNVADITINDSVAALNDVDGLIIAAPKTAFTDKELYVIDQFVMRGGKLMCLLDAVELNEDSLNANGNTHTKRLETGIDEMLFDYGLKLNDNLVVDAKCLRKIVPYAKQPFLNWFYYVMASPTQHPMSKNVEPVSLKYTSEIEMLDIDSVTVSPILTSSSNSNVTGYAPLVSLGMPLNYGENPELVPNPTDETNKRTLGAVAEGRFVSRFRNRVVEEYTKSVANDKDLLKYNYLPNSQKPGKVLLIGNGRFIANSLRPDERGMPRPYFPSLAADEEMTIYSRSYVLIGNQEFFQNMVDYMMDESSVIGLRSRKVDINALDKNKLKKDAQFYKLLNIIVPVLLVAVLAMLMLLFRKRKYAK
jgi:gliding-associated putative ABC transporter substrate-binding component GldG